MRKSGRLANALVVLAAARVVIAAAAIPLAPLLYEDHFLVLVLMRPTKEVLLAAGFLARQGRVPLLQIVAAAIPLALLGVWQMYYLGRQYSDRISAGRIQPKLAARVLPVDRIRRLQRVLKRKGTRLVVLGRLAVFPSALVGAAAGSADLRSRHFLPADALGAMLSIGEVVGAGYLLGYAYKNAGPWITGMGLLSLAGVAILLGRYLQRS